MGQTMAEKVFSSHNVAGSDVYAGDSVDAKVDGLLLQNYQALRGTYRRIGYPDGPPTVFDRDKVFLMNDHVQPPADVQAARDNYESKLDANRLGLPHFYESEMGVCHQMMLDYGHVRPGDLIVGNDSHTISYGAVNSAATGIGTDEAAYVLAFGQLFFTVPETIKITLNGTPRDHPFGKDIILYLAGRYGDSFGQNCSLEFGGPLAESMSLANRLTIADHAVEVGAKFGLFLADEKTREYPGRTAGVDRPLSPDSDARYVEEIVVDCDSIGFQVAKPHRFDNVVPVGETTGVRIDQARLGSCANGRFEDIEIAARMLKGRRVAPHVRFYISPASMSVYKQCVDAGLVSTLLESGANFDRPGCAICQTPGIVLNEEVCISSTTRNYRGRFGGATCSDAQIYLASPATVAASAIAGEIVDPTEYMR